MLASPSIMKNASTRTYDSRRGLFTGLREEGVSPRVVDVMERVRREEFLPPTLRDAAYVDTSLPIGHGQTISEPASWP
jgi:protein-L-isoaspartate(D-aspartate) O-methyltransferase